MKMPKLFLSLSAITFLSGAAPALASVGMNTGDSTILCQDGPASIARKAGDTKADPKPARPAAPEPKQDAAIAL